MSGPYGVTSITVTVPMVPTIEHGPNGRGHWRKRKRLNDALFAAARLAAVSQRNTVGGGPIFRGPVHVAITIARGKNRKPMDADNALACCKSLVDGLAGAELFANDRQCTFAPVEQVRDPEGRGYVRVVVSEVKA